jgi:plastocyanin
MRALRFVLASGALVLIAGAPAAFGQTQVKSGSARIVNFDFAPRDIEVDAGTTLTWTNTADRPHTVSDRGGTFDSGPVQPGKQNAVLFSVPGRYLYFCRINPAKMNGTIVVKPGARPPVVSRIQAIDPAREGEVLRFDPAQLNLETGSSIIFANVGGKPHTLTADDGSFDTGVVTPGAEGGRFAGSNASVTLSKPGTFAFHCEVHPQAMKGVLNVTGPERKAPGAASAAPRTLDIPIKDFEFVPKEASVAPGGQVTWRNTGQARHTATFDDEVALDTSTLAPGASATLTAPAKPGSYSYHCNIHPAKMRGVLVVVGQNVADPTKVERVAPVAATKEPSRGGVAALALATGVVGAFVGGFGISAFVRNKMGAE